MLPQGRHLLQRNLLQFHRRQVAAVFAESPFAGPVEVFCCSDLDVSGVPPWPRHGWRGLINPVLCSPLIPCQRGNGAVRSAPLPNLTKRPAESGRNLPPKLGRSRFATLSVSITALNRFIHALLSKNRNADGMARHSTPVAAQTDCSRHTPSPPTHTHVREPNPSVVVP